MTRAERIILLETDIANIEAALRKNLGVVRVSVGGITTEFNRESLTSLLVYKNKQLARANRTRTINRGITLVNAT